MIIKTLKISRILTKACKCRDIQAKLAGHFEQTFNPLTDMKQSFESTTTVLLLDKFTH